MGVPEVKVADIGDAVQVGIATDELDPEVLDEDEPFERRRREFLPGEVDEEPGAVHVAAAERAIGREVVVADGLLGAQVGRQVLLVGVRQDGDDRRVGAEFFDTYFEHCSRLLKPHGAMGLQAITIDDRHYEQARDTVDFIKEEVRDNKDIF